MDQNQFAGPTDLARHVSDQRNWQAEADEFLPDKLREAVLSTKGPISNQSLERLLTLAYHASMVADEGRYTRIRLFVPSNSPYLRPALTIQFANPLPLGSIGDLRRLGPAVSSPDYAAMVIEHESRLYCEGIAALHDVAEVRPIGDSHSTGRRRYRGLMVRVDAPGEIRVTERQGTWALKNGRLNFVMSFHTSPLVREWLGWLSKDLVEHLTNTGYPEASSYLLAHHPLILEAWSKVLLGAVELRHGGAFVVIPRDPPPDVDIKFPARNVSLGEAIMEYWIACIQVDRCSNKEGYAAAAFSWSEKRHGLFSQARALAQLSAVDGCVVVDRSLKLHGFGAEIRIDEDRLKGQGRVFTNYATGEPREENDLRQFGTRHNSAFRLCKANGDLIVFVISQDGDMRVFSSDAQRVYQSEPLSPSAMLRDQW